MSRLKETNEELINKLKLRIASKEISEQEVSDLTNVLKCVECGKEINEKDPIQELKAEVEEIKKLLIINLTQKRKSKIPFTDEAKLLEEYKEAYQNPQRLAETHQWEQAALNDWAERESAKKSK